MRPRATSAASPRLFIRQSSQPIRQTSELPDFRTSERIAASGEPSLTSTQWRFSLRRNGDRARHRSWVAIQLRNAAPPRARRLRSVPSGAFSLRRNGGQAWQSSWATTLSRNSQLRCCSGGVDPIDWEKQTSGRQLRGGGTSEGSALRLPIGTDPCRRAQKRRSRTNYEESTILRRRRGHFRENMPGRTKHLRDALFQQSPNGYLSAEVDLAGGERTDHGEPSGRRATLAVWPWLFFRGSRPATRKDNKLERNFSRRRQFGPVSSDFTGRFFPTQAERRPRETE